MSRLKFKPTKDDRKRAKKIRGRIKRPIRTVTAARLAGLHLASACALLEKESFGGKNVYGRDAVRNPIKSPLNGYKRVTRRNYALYKKYRQQGFGMQGVGPTQLTWYALQDQADLNGGAWRPFVNMYVGFRHLKSLIKENGLRNGARSYNGTGPAAERYADDFIYKYNKWYKELN